MSTRVALPVSVLLLVDSSDLGGDPGDGDANLSLWGVIFCTPVPVPGPAVMGLASSVVVLRLAVVRV